MPAPLRRCRVAGILSAVALLLAALLAGSFMISSHDADAATSTRSHHQKPTAVLVHGAWADGSSWDGVVQRLQHDGYTVDVFPTPLRGLASDTAYLRTYLAAISGPIVLVGHSYGGAVITDAATGNPNVKALVFIDAFALEEGETVLELSGSDSALANPDPSKVFTFVPAGAPTPTTDLYVLPSVFVSAFANDLPAKQGAVLAATQRPVTFGALTEPSTTPAWKTIPSWYLVGTVDKVITPTQQLFMAHRADAHITKVRASHLVMISRPAAVTRIIESAAAAA